MLFSPYYAVYCRQKMKRSQIILDDKEDFFAVGGWGINYLLPSIYMLRTSLTTDQLYDELFNINSLSLSLFLSLSLSLLLFHYGYRPHKRTFLSTPLLSNRALSMTSMKCIYDEEQIFIILFIFG